jgi:CHAD domain-containing protein
MKASPNIRKYALDHARALLRRLAYQANRTLQNGDAECVHDLRVAVRRFGHCLLVFAQFFPRQRARKISRRLRKLMGLAAEVRNRDVALGLLAHAGVPAGSALARRMAGERARAGRELLALIESWQRRDFSRRWRARLEL